MFCENCGKQIPDSSVFCEECGTRVAVEAAPAAPVAEPVPVVPAKKITVAGLIAKAKEIHQKNKLIFPIAGAVAVVAIALIIVFSILGKQVSMKNYLEITMEGYDGYGSISYQFGDVSFGMRAAGDKDCKEFGDEDDDENFLNYDKSEVSKDYRKNLTKAQKLVSSVEISYELPEGKSNDTLKNGDEIVFTIAVNEKYAEDLGIKIKDTTFTYVVEGLQPVSQFDILSYFDLKAEGYDGYGKVELVCSQSGTKQVGNVTFEMEAGEGRIRYSHQDGYSGTIWISLEGETYNKFNGDIMKAVVELDADYFITDGVELVGLEKEYTVSGLQDTVKVNLLDYYKITFEGVDASGTAKLEPTQETLAVGDMTVNLQTGEWMLGEERVTRTYVWLSDDWGLKNGETIKLKCDPSESFFSEKGIKITESEKELTVSGLATYVTKLEEIKSYTEQETAAKQIVLDYLNDSWSLAVHNSYFGSYKNQSIGEDMKLHKMVLTTPQSTASNDKNALWMIFSVTISDNKITTPTVYYFAVRYDDVAVYSDGTLYFPSNGAKQRGYDSYDALYTSLIESYNLNIEVSE